MISELSYANFKNRTATHKLTAVTVVVGDNKSGKTSLLDGLDFAMTGQLPSIAAKTSADVFQVASGKPYLESRVVTEVGSNFRRLEKRGEKITGTHDCHVEFPLILRDANLYFGLSDKARVALVASLVKLDEAKGFSVPELLASVKNIKLEANSEASEAAVLRAYNSLSSQDQATPLDWLATAVEKAKADLKSANDNCKRMVAVTVGISQLQSQDAEQAQATGAVESQLGVARKALGLLQEQAGHLAFQVNECKRRRARRDELLAVAKPGADEKALEGEFLKLGSILGIGRLAVSTRPRSTAELWGDVQRLVAEGSAASAEVARLAKRKEELATAKQPEGVDGEKLKADAQNFRELYALHHATVVGREKTVMQVVGEVEELKSRHAVETNKCTNARKQAAEIEAEVANFTALDHCPTCLATGSAWQAAWKSQQDAKVSALNIEVQSAVDQRVTLGAEIERLEKVMVAMRADDEAVAQAKEQLDAVTATLTKNEAALATYAAAQAELAAATVSHQEATVKVESLRAQWAAANAAHGEAKNADDTLAEQDVAETEALEKLEAARKSLADWKAAQAEAATVGDCDVEAATGKHTKHQEAVARKQDEIGGLEEKARTVALNRADLKRQMEAVAAAEKASAEAEVLKATVALLQDKQAELVAVAFGGLLKVVNRFSSCVIEQPLVYFKGELGYWLDGTTFVSSATFSGAEELVTFAGLCVALASASPQRVVVLDEMSRIDAKRKEAFVKQLLSLIESGVIHQAILCDVDGAAYRKLKSDKLSIIELS